MKLIFIYLVTFVGASLGIVTSLYLAISIIGMLGFKIYRKIKYGYSLYD